MCAHSIKTKLEENLNCKRDKAGVDNLIYRNIGVLWRGTDILVGSQFRFQRRKWQLTPVLLPGKSHGRREEPGGLQSMGLLSQIRLSDFTFTFHVHALEKEMATHSSVLAWRIPGMGEPGGLPSVGSHRVGHD